MTQARARATRNRILSAAVTLFSQDGYGVTGLSDIQQHAEVTKGAFYYHFESKEAVAAAVIEECRSRLRTTFRDAVDPPATPGIAPIIRGTFAVARLLQSDDTVRVGNQLSQALGQVSDAGSRILSETTAAFIDVVKKAATSGDLRADLDPEEVGEAIWVNVLGCQFLSAAIGDDLVARLARAWRIMLHAIVPDESLIYFTEVVERCSRDEPSTPI